MILYTENAKETTAKLINEFSKVAGYKVDMQKLIIFLYTCNEHSENEIKKTIPFIIASKNTGIDILQMNYRSYTMKTTH